MSRKHTGNTIPEIAREEHEHTLEPATKNVLSYGYDGSAKQILKVDSNGRLSLPTIFSVVNTAATGQSSIVLDTGANWIGLATTVIGSSPTLFAVVNTAAAGQSSIVLDTGSKWIGLATVNLGAAIPAGTNAIGKLAANSGVDIGDVDITTIGSVVTIVNAPYSYYQQASLISGYVYHGFTIPGSNPTTAAFRLMRESLNFGDVLFASGVATYLHIWSAASTASINYS